MPRAFKPCKQVGCWAMTKDGYCEQHSHKVAEHDRHRASASERGYNWAWHKRAKSYKRRHPLCVVCELEGRVTETAVPHHIEPVSSGGKVHVSDDELLPVCVPCHRRVEGLGYGWRSVIGKRQ